MAAGATSGGDGRNQSDSDKEDAIGLITIGQRLRKQLLLNYPTGLFVEDIGSLYEGKYKIKLNPVIYGHRTFEAWLKSEIFKPMLKFTTKTSSKRCYVWGLPGYDDKDDFAKLEKYEKEEKSKAAGLPEVPQKPIEFRNKARISTQSSEIDTAIEAETIGTPTNTSSADANHGKPTFPVAQTATVATEIIDLEYWEPDAKIPKVAENREPNSDLDAGGVKAASSTTFASAGIPPGITEPNIISCCLCHCMAYFMNSTKAHSCPLLENTKVGENSSPSVPSVLQFPMDFYKITPPPIRPAEHILDLVALPKMESSFQDFLNWTKAQPSPNPYIWKGAATLIPSSPAEASEQRVQQNKSRWSGARQSEQLPGCEPTYNTTVGKNVSKPDQPLTIAEFSECEVTVLPLRAPTRTVPRNISQSGQQISRPFLKPYPSAVSESRNKFHNYNINQSTMIQRPSSGIPLPCTNSGHVQTQNGIPPKTKRRITSTSSKRLFEQRVPDVVNKRSIEQAKSLHHYHRGAHRDQPTRVGRREFARNSGIVCKETTYNLTKRQNLALKLLRDYEDWQIWDERVDAPEMVFVNPFVICVYGLPLAYHWENIKHDFPLASIGVLEESDDPRFERKKFCKLMYWSSTDARTSFIRFVRNMRNMGMRKLHIEFGRFDEESLRGRQ